MSFTLEIPTEVENALRDVAKRRGRDVGSYIMEIALEQGQREEEKRRLRLEALQELADLSQELDLDRVS